MLFETEAEIKIDKVFQLKEVFACMTVEEYRQRYCCQTRCDDKRIEDQKIFMGEEIEDD